MIKFKTSPRRDYKINTSSIRGYPLDYRGDRSWKREKKKFAPASKRYQVPGIRKKGFCSDTHRLTLQANKPIIYEQLVMRLNLG